MAVYDPPVALDRSKPLRSLVKQLPLRVLSPVQFQQWQTDGYAVVSNAVPVDNVRRTMDFLWEFQELDPQDPETWNRAQLRSIDMPGLNNSGMVEAYNHQTLWDNRQSRRVYDAFVDIWDREDLWVTIDRANLNTPNRGVRAFDGFIHWDCDTTEDPPAVGVQGVLSLVDTTEDVGGFQCVPEIYRDFAAWKRSQPEDRDGWKPDLGKLEPTFVPLKAGDLIVWNSLLPHGIRANRSDRPRIAQYISMSPAKTDESVREARIRSWRERLPPEGMAFPGDPRDWERARYQTAKLSDLGEALLGLKSWPPRNDCPE
ncbi:MAG: phytanoyl-CoA dioxygenase family protein [Pseudomonadota bacterium]